MVEQSKEQKKLLKDAQKNILQAIVDKDYSRLEKFHLAGYNFDYTASYKYFMGLKKSYHITPLGHAIENGADPEMVTFLMNKGASPLSGYTYPLNIKHTDYGYAIMRALDLKRLDTVKLMLNHPKFKKNIIQRWDDRNYHWFGIQQLQYRFENLYSAFKEIAKTNNSNLMTLAQDKLAECTCEMIVKNTEDSLTEIFKKNNIPVPTELNDLLGTIKRSTIEPHKKKTVPLVQENIKASSALNLKKLGN